MYACVVVEPVAEQGFDGQTVHSAGNLVAFGGRKEVVYGVVGHGDLKGAVCHLKLAAPCGCAGKHFAVAPRGCLGRFQQHFADFFGVCFVGGHQIGKGWVFEFAYIAFGKLSVGFGLDVLPRGGHYAVGAHGFACGFDPRGGEQQRRVLDFCGCADGDCKRQQEYGYVFFHHDI